MQILKHSMAVCLACFAGNCLAADSFEDGVPVELVEEFTSGSISAGLPADFPALEFPESVTLMGSLDVNFSQVVVFNTDTPGEEAGMALAESFIDQGWELLVPFNYQAPTTGFVYPDAQPVSIGADQQYCHDRYGTLTITPSSRENIISVRLANQALMQPGFSCQQQNDQRRMQQQRTGGMPFNMPNAEYMPRLELPADENRTPRRGFPFGGIGGFSGSSNDLETRGTVTGDWTAADLRDHFTSQLEDQGWTLDSQWAGDLLAGSNWTISPRDNLAFIGILSVMERSEGLFDLQFRLVTRGGGQGPMVRVGAINLVSPAGN